MTASPGVLRWSAAEIVRMHTFEELVSWQTGVCAHCPDGDGPCRLLAWAEDIQAGKDVPPPEPREQPWPLTSEADSCPS